MPLTETLGKTLFCLFSNSEHIQFILIVDWETKKSKLKSNLGIIAETVALFLGGQRSINNLPLQYITYYLLF